MWQAIAGIGSSLLGGLFGSSGASKQNKAQMQMAREQMDFQREMSDTAHRREVYDLKKAGLNPILSAKLGGASSPAGAMPNIVNEMAPLQNSAQSMGEKMYNFRVQDATVSNMKLQNDLLKEQVESQRISNARQGLMTPAWETGGKLVDKLVGALGPWVEGTADKGLAGTSDIVQEVMDAANAETGVLPSVSTASRLARDIRAIAGSSEAGKYVRGEKSFLQSFKDANKHLKKDDEGPRKLTREKLEAYGWKRLEEIRRRAGK